MAIKKTTIKILKLKKDLPLPYHATPGAAGYDLTAAENTVIKAHSFGIVSTGIALELPPGIEAQIRPRSGLAFHRGIGILNSPGTIDSDYRGEIKVILFNTSDSDFIVEAGDRIAQIVFSRILPVEFKEVVRLSSTKRNKSGFGHTG